MPGMAPTAEEIARERAAAQQNEAQRTNQPVNWNSNVQVGTPGGSSGGGGPDQPLSYNDRKEGRRHGRGGGGRSNPGQPGGMTGMPVQPAQPYNPLSSLPPQQGPVAPPMGMTAEQAAAARAANNQNWANASGTAVNWNGNPQTASSGQGSPWHHNYIADTVGPGKPYGTYDEAFNALNTPQPSGPGGPPMPEEQGGGGRGGRGGGRGRGQGDTGVPTAPGGGDTASQIAQLSRDQGGRIFKMDGNLRGILASMGRAPQFAQLLQSLGFSPIGQINPDGFYNDWIVPTNLQMTPEYMAMLQGLDPVDQISLQMMLGQLFGLQAGGATEGMPGAVPGVTPVAPGQPGGGFDQSAPLIPGQGDFGMGPLPNQGIPFAPNRSMNPMPGQPNPFEMSAPLLPGQGDFGMPQLPGGPGMIPGIPKR